MRIAITSRIFEPEPSAATFRLRALANAFVEAGHEVTVLTSSPPKRLRRERAGRTRRYSVRRFPVLRDRSGYLRGYIPYMSFDIPLFVRLVFGPRWDLVIAEPPPTSGCSVRLATKLKRTPYAYYAADIWSDAAAQAGTPHWVVRVVRCMELFALRGARMILSVSEGVTERLRELGISDAVTTIGNGVDADAFARGLHYFHDQSSESPCFVYAGTASEWHGAGVFLEALPQVIKRYPGVRLRFIGGGSELQAMRTRAVELGIDQSVAFEPALPPEKIAPVLRRATAAVASVRPGCGYDFAFPTKLYSAAVCGAPMIYAGIGPGEDFVNTLVGDEPLGLSVPFSPRHVADAMMAYIEREADPQRTEQVSQWARQNVGLDVVAARAVSRLAGELGSGECR